MSESALTITALTIADAAKVLSAAGQRAITPAMIEQDIDAGAPVNDNGTINLMHYTAWLVKELANGNRR